MKMNQNKGFTLIELAIVLVIIGLIVGAVLKGQDLIDNAKAKKFVSKVRAWEVSQWTYLDRKGVFTGDNDKDGKIGDGNVRTDFIGASFTTPPYGGATGSEINTIVLGSMSFYVFFGTNAGNDLGNNVMIICKSTACAALTESELLYLESLDVSIDGSSDGTDGQLIGISSAPSNIAAGQWEARYNATPTAAAWTADTTRAAVYYFDGKP